MKAILVVFDSLNRRSLGCYGGGSTPSFDRLARRGVTFRQSLCGQPALHAGPQGHANRTSVLSASRLGAARAL